MYKIICTDGITRYTSEDDLQYTLDELEYYGHEVISVELV